MSKHAVTSQNAPKPAGPYSQAVIQNGFLFTAGFGPQNSETGAVPDGITAQTRQVLENIAAVLSAAGLSLADVVKSTVHLRHLERDFADFNAAYAQFFSEPYPVRTTVGSELSGILVEIDVVAGLPAAS